jgi:hypothetical protein
MTRLSSGPSEDGLAEMRGVSMSAPGDLLRRERREASDLVEKLYDYEEWRRRIPSFRVPSGCEIQLVPPFQGVLVRCVISRGDAWVSVFLDSHDAYRVSREPYWEIYPDATRTDGEAVSRFLMNDVDALSAAIEATILAQEGAQA